MYAKISVVMPVYNTQERHLRSAIESILEQTYSDFEFIIVDDGSTENKVPEVIKSYADKRIRYLYQENGGIARALNYGIAHAGGEYIARMDSDDISLPERFFKQAAILDVRPEISIVGSWLEHFPETKVIKTPEYPTILSFLKECSIGHPTVMWRKADFDKYGLRYLPEYRCEDYELWSRAVRVLQFYNIQEVLLKYRYEGQNITVKKAEEMAKHSQRVQQNILDFLTNNADLQKRIMLLLEHKELKKTVLQEIFSIKNMQIEGKKQKLITLLGQEFVKLKR